MMIVNYTIRQVEEKDNLSLATIIRKVFEEHDAPRQGTVYSDPTTDNLFELFQTTKAILWVVEIDKQPVGCCGIYPTSGLENGCAELVKFYVSGELQSLGYGRLLMERCIESAKELGYKKIYLESMPQFAKAVGIYQKQGFRNLTHPLGNSGHSGCTIWMEREL